MIEELEGWTELMNNAEEEEDFITFKGHVDEIQLYIDVLFAKLNKHRV